MKILIEGDLNKVDSVTRFECPACGCVFEANAAEYRVEPDWRSGNYKVCACPCCGKEVAA